MAYSTDNPPRLICQSVGAGSPQTTNPSGSDTNPAPSRSGALWFYTSTDPLTDVRVDGYFSNGYDLGMRAGDVVIVVDNDASPVDFAMAVVDTATASGGVDLTDGTELAGADTD